MAYTEEQCKALRETIASGQLQVRYADRSITYRSVDEMVQILRLMESERAMAENSSDEQR